MIIVILAICFVALIVGIAVFQNNDEDVGEGIIFFSLVGFIVSLIVTIILGIQVKNLIVIDEKIEMYQTENSKIETQIADTVKQYQKYETEIFTEVAPDSAITLVALYPELKSDALVQKQIEVYIANNEKIKTLKESKITGNIKRWWLYFGG